MWLLATCLRGQDGDVGRSYLETQHATGQMFGENRPILLLLMQFSASVSFRQLPLSPASFRFGPRLVRVAYGRMAGGQADDVGRAYLETQQAMGQICGKIDRF